MASSATPLGLNKQGTGDNVNTWGNVLNAEALDLIDEAIRGMVSFSLSGTKTLDATNYEPNEARCAFINVTGGTGGTVSIPSISKLYMVRNASTGNVIISTGGATTATIEAGMVAPVVCDGASVWTLRIADLNLKDYIDAAILDGTVTDLPATTGNEGKALIVASGLWAPTTWIATAAQIWASVASLVAISPAGAQEAREAVALTDGATITPDLNAGANFTVTLGGNRTLANPSNLKKGKSGIITVKQDATGSRTLAYGSGWKFPGGTPAVSTGANAADTIAYYVEDAATPIIRAVMAKAYS